MRDCAYCGKTRADGCRCQYRAKRKRIDGLNYGISVTCESTRADTTLADLMDSIKQALPVSSKEPEKAIGTWRWSFDLAEPAEEKEK
jgi:hypothetical protein